MCNHSHEVLLGFTNKKVPEGTHMCLVFTDEQERIDSMLKFLLSGLQSDERVACFSERVTEDEVRHFFKENNISYDERKSASAISISGTSEVYFHENKFDPERMLATIAQYYDDSKTMGFSASRVIGEMVPEVEKIEGGDRLLEYESRITMLLREKPITAVCQYDANLFDGATIMEVLKVHPQMIVNGEVVNNPFFIEPEEYLGIGK